MTLQALSSPLDVTRSRLTSAQERPPVDRDDALCFEAEIDRIYLETPAVLELIDGDTALTVKQVGFTDTVIRNPGAALAAPLTDLPGGGQRHFACVEAASVALEARLAPGGKSHGSQTLIG